MNIALSTFLICYIGEVLTEKCKEIGNMVYMTNWYRLSDKDILNLIMIITRSSVEYKMTAGKIIDMSVITFGNVCLFLPIFKEKNFKQSLILENTDTNIFKISDNKNYFCIFKYITPNDNIVKCTCIEYIKKNIYFKKKHCTLIIIN